MTDSNPSPLRDRLEAAVRAVGLAPRGVVRATPGDRVPALPDGRAALSLLLVGWRGRDGWAAFEAAPEARDGAPDPLDRWSRRVIGGLAETHGAAALFPFAGPPWHPFQSWARRAEGLSPSPLGLLIDAEVGLWHAYRGALAVAEDLGPEASPQTAPCASCAHRSCLSACPVDAFGRPDRPTGYDVAACRDLLESHVGGLCRTDGCRCRDACPVGRAHRYAPAQLRFLMRAFRASPLPSRTA